MKKLSLLLAAVPLLTIVGCGAGGASDSDDKALRKELSGPPSMEALAKKHPSGANKEKMKGAAGGGAPAAAGGQ
jgi:hypothetical protein